MPRLMVVDSPPGMTRPSSPSRSAGTRTSSTSAPSRSRTPVCAAKSPWRARTPISGAPPPDRPISGAPGAPLPATLGEQLIARELGRLEAGHGPAQPLRGGRHPLGVAVVRGRLDDRAGAALGILGLEDPRPHEHRLGPHLHAH